MSIHTFHVQSQIQMIFKTVVVLVTMQLLQALVCPDMNLPERTELAIHRYREKLRRWTDTRFALSIRDQKELCFFETKLQQDDTGEIKELQIEKLTKEIIQELVERHATRCENDLQWLESDSLHPERMSRYKQLYIHDTLPDFN